MSATARGDVGELLAEAGLVVVLGVVLIAIAAFAIQQAWSRRCAR